MRRKATGYIEAIQQYKLDWYQVFLCCSVITRTSAALHQLSFSKFPVTEAVGTPFYATETLPVVDWQGNPRYDTWICIRRICMGNFKRVDFDQPNA